MNRIFCLFLMVPFMALASSLQDGLVAWYKFDGNANDSSGNGNNGTVHGVTLTTDRNGNPDSAYSFDGDDWISVAHDDSLNPDALTVSVWMKPSDWYNGHIPIICKSNASWQEGSYRSQIDNHGDTVTFMLRGSASADNCIEFGKWQLITLTLDKQCMCVYRNGVLVGRDDAPGAIQKKSDDIGIGRNIVGATEYFKGVMDDFRIYSRALSADEVKLLYNGQEDETASWSGKNGNPSSWTPNGNNVLRGVVATFSGTRFNESGRVASSDPLSRLTDGVVNAAGSSFANTIGIRNGTLTWQLAVPVDLTGLRINTHWCDGGLDGINLTSVEIQQDGSSSWTALPNSAFDFGMNNDKTSGDLEFLYATEAQSVFAENVTAIRFNLGTQDNSGTGFTEFEAIGVANPAADLIHRWSFNGNLSDSVGGQTAKIVGNATTDGRQYTLAGGSRGSSYINLGANLLPKDGRGATIEIWAAQNSVQNWSRIWDVGTNEGTSSLGEMYVAWTNGKTLNSAPVCMRDVAADVGNLGPYSLGVEYHIAAVFEPQNDGTWKVRFYKQDAATGATTTSYIITSTGDWSLAKQAQGSFFLGHGHHTDTGDANASYNEVRIWSRALTEAELTANALLGPDVLPGDSSEPEIPIYTITFDANGGTPTPTAVARKEGEVCGTLPTVTRKGYLFLGWFIAKDDGAQVMEDSIVDSSCTLYAHWQENRHTIKFDTGCGAVLPDVMQLDGFTFGDLPVMTRSGFDFLGWYTDAVGGVQYTKNSIITADCVLFAHWKCHFNFEWSGGGRLDICSGTRRTDEAQGIAMDSAWGDGGARAVVSVDGVEKAESKGVDEFVWRGDETKEYTLKHQVYDAQGRTVGEPYTAKIAWTSRAAVTFDGGNGEEAFSREYDKSYAYGELPSVTKTGHTFAGWYTAAAGGEKVEAGAQFDGSVSKLYAHWTVNQYGVKFDKNGGEGSAGDLTVAYGDVVPMDGVAFRKSGYRLAGWATAADGAAVYGQSGVMSNLTAVANGSVQLYAVWEPTTVDLRSFKQRYPWNGFVDVECEVGAEGRVGLMLIDEELGTNFTAKTLFCQGGSVTNSALWMTEGPQKFIWGAGTDLPDGFKTSKLKAKTYFAEGEE